MTNRWHTLARLAPLSLLLLAGCFQSGTVDRCDAQKTCLAVDPVGCCAPGGSDVSICDVCPAGTVEQSTCQTSGCEVCDTPIQCRRALADSCCGDLVFTAECDSCPAGSVPVSECGDIFPACGCAMGGIRPPDQPPIFCLEDLGAGCCGGMIASPDACGCPEGTIVESECGGHAGAGDRIRPPDCFVDEGAGCCGLPVAANACGTCPEGTVSADLCVDSPADPDFFPVPSCFVNENGCCGAPVGANSCGSCPPGTLAEGECPINDEPGFIPLVCFAELGGGCCGEQIDATSCGECPSGSVSLDACSAFQSGGDAEAPAADPVPSEPAPGEAPAPPPEGPQCFREIDETCCGEPVEINACGECPEGTTTLCRGIIPVCEG